MNMDIQLFLLPVGEPLQVGPVSSVLNAAGYSIELLHLNNFLAVTPKRPRAPLVLLLGKNQPAVDHFADLLATKNRNPLFLVIEEGSGAQIDKSILRLCDEFTCWPCKKEEMALHVEKLISDHKAAPINYARIAEEFVEFNLIGQSEAFLKLLARIKKIAQCDAPALLEGQTGTGKELAARAIHYLSERRDYPFIPVNCGALPDSLIENELFGHAKGAYTDASQAQVGVVKQAHGGTLFLDEVDTLTPKAQITLLRFLQDQRYRPLGAQALKEANVRIIAATNLSLDELVKQGQFRQDLFFRLNVMSAHLPPLCERENDAILLAQEFMRQLRIRYKQPDKSLHSRTLKWIRRYSWPGNVRELENFIHREFLLAENEIIGAELNSLARPQCRRVRADRRCRVSFDQRFTDAKLEVIANFEKSYLSWLMEECAGNVTMAALRAGKERRAMGKLLKKHGIDKTMYGGAN